MNYAPFKEIIWNYYAHNKRAFAWRDTDNPYYVVVSEIMLQQTQTHRVVPKFEQFITEFADFGALAQAPFKDVLSVWQGLGYNRRARYLHAIAHYVSQNDCVLPKDPKILVTLPGIGPNTAASIAAFAFNAPTVFIETNIRTVFIQHFFGQQELVHDKQLLPLVQATLDQDDPRQWYYALMDYGVMLKKSGPNPSRKSAHHAVQSKFQGSDRQIRGMILRYLIEHNHVSQNDIIAAMAKEPDRVKGIIAGLVADGLIRHNGQEYSI